MSQPKRPWITSLVVLLSAFTAHSVNAEILSPSDDGFARGGNYANDDYTHEDNLIVKNSANISYDRKSYLNFDFSNVDIDSIKRVVLQVFAQKIYKNMTLNVQQGETPWNGFLSWNTAPTANLSIGAASTLINPEQSNSWVEIDVTELAKGINGRQLSLIIEDPNEGRGNGASFHSIENTNAPQLVITTDGTIPAPNAVRAEYLDGQVILDWVAPVLDIKQAEVISITGYNILRKLDTESNFSVLISNTASTDTYFVDDTAQTGNSYTYKVSAIAVDTANDIDINSPLSNEATLAPFTTTNNVTVDIQTDANRDGYVNAEDNFGEDVWSSGSGAVFGPNLDDDDNDGIADGRDDLPNGEEDLLDMGKVVLKKIDNLKSNDKVQLEVRYDIVSQPARSAIFNGDVDAQKPKFFYLYEEEDRWIPLGPAFRKEGNVNTISFSARLMGASDNTIYVDSLFGRHPGFDGNVKITLKVIRNSKVISQDEVALKGAPVLYSHTLQKLHGVYISDPAEIKGIIPIYNKIFENLDPSINLFEAPAPSIWTQDAGQFGYSQKPTKSGLDTTSIDTRVPSGSNSWFGTLGTDRGFINFAGISSKKINAGGNIEVIPPYTHNGVSYPLGRLVVGGSVDAEVPVKTVSNVDISRDLIKEMMDFFESQGVQGLPIVLPSAWLNIGHIDEMFKILPNLNAAEDERSWVIAIASPEKGLEIDNRKFYENNMAIQIHIINEIKEIFKREIGLTDKDFVDVPMLYTEYGGSYHPNVINMQAIGTDLHVPDPEARLVDGVDPFKEAARTALEKLGYNVHFEGIKGIFFQGNSGGGIHCGTNVEFEAVKDVPWWRSEQ